LRLRPASRVPVATARSMSRSSACMSARSERAIMGASFISADQSGGADGRFYEAGVGVDAAVGSKH
jgi:hypothetical protein